MINRSINIYFSWTELPSYGYFMLKYFNSKLKNYKFINFKVISNPGPAQNDYKENDEFYNSIIWIDKAKKYNWDDLGLKIPEIFFQSGWHVPCFSYLGKLVKKHNKNNKVVILADNSAQKKNLKQTVGKYVFKFFLKQNFDYALVPGSSGKNLMVSFGFKKSEVFKGLYCALIDTFKINKFINKRKKQFLYVGQFIRRKNLIKLIKAFKLACLRNDDWKLILIGSGNINLKKFNLGKKISIIDKLKPKRLKNFYKESNFFILPSSREHWGLVVHEASLSGCILLLSDTIGSIPEFATKKNSILFNANSVNSIKKSIEKAMSLSDEKLALGSKESMKLASTVSYENCYAQISKIVNKCLKKKIIKNF